MPLPLLLSLPHAGLLVPDTVSDICGLSRAEIAHDGDEGAAQIYGPLKGEVQQFVTTETARAVVDVNRAADDFRKDGVIKTHTCWDVRIYTRAPTDQEIQTLLREHHTPYHKALSKAAATGVRMGIDCHTMAATGPPVGPDPGQERPEVCLGNGDGTCPEDWLRGLADCFSNAFGCETSLNAPFRGGYIIRAHATELPWVQIELSRAAFLTDDEKCRRTLAALTAWCA